MNLWVVLFVGALATGILHLLMQGRLEEIKGGFLAAALWFLFSWGMTNLTVVADNGTIVSDPHPSMAIMGIVMGAISVVIGLFGVAPFVNVFNTGVDETGTPDEFR